MKINVDEPSSRDTLKEIKELEIPDYEMDDLSSKIINNSDFSLVQRSLLHLTLALKAVLDMEKQAEITSLGSFTLEADPFGLLGTQNRIEHKNISTKGLVINVDESRLDGKYDERGLATCTCGCNLKIISKKMFVDFLKKNYSDIDVEASIFSVTNNTTGQVSVTVNLFQQLPKE